jgi:hypothetical protein
MVSGVKIKIFLGLLCFRVPLTHKEGLVIGRMASSRLTFRGLHSVPKAALFSILTLPQGRHVNANGKTLISSLNLTKTTLQDITIEAN